MSAQQGRDRASSASNPAGSDGSQSKSTSFKPKLSTALKPSSSVTQSKPGPSFGSPSSADGSVKKHQGDAEPEPKQDDHEAIDEKKQTNNTQSSKTYSKMLKILLYDNAKGLGKPIATFGLDTVGEPRTLVNVRDKLGKSIAVDQNFCYPDGTAASDELSLDTYLDHLEEDAPEDATKVPRSVYVSPLPGQNAPASKPKTSSVISKTPFVIAVYQYEVPAAAGDGEGVSAGTGEGSLTSRGTVHSKVFEGTDAAAVTLAGLRKKIAAVTPMSTGSRIHKFCTPKGVTVADESMTFLDYLKLEEVAAPEDTSLPSVTVVYKLDTKLNNPKVDMSKLPGGPESVSAALNDKLFEGGMKAKEFASTQRTFTIDAEFKSEIKDADMKNMKSAGLLTEEEWAVVIANCGVMFGWIVDRQRHEIIRAPKAAFQLRPRTSEDPIHLIPDVIKPKNVKSKKQVKDGAEGEEETEGAGEEEVEGEEEEEVEKPRKPTTVMPRYRVNDDSKIDITMSSHEFETSMAKNNFSSNSTEGSLSGGYAGFSATVTAGYAASNSKGESQTNNTYNKTMIANYLFPRADIFLHPDDLELTPDLKQAIQKIEKDKDIKDLRQLYRDYGQLFCKQVIVGGRLQSTKILNTKSTINEQSEKEQYKISVGVQVSTPFGVGAGVKHEQEKGKEEQKKQAQEDQRETVVFEAVGGNTILAAKPEEWVISVGRHANWRVISRDLLSPMVDMISGIFGYSKVKEYFVQAVPTLSKYIELPSTRETKIRLQLTSPTIDLSLSFLQGFEDFKHLQPMYYLGHKPQSMVEPRLHSVRAMSGGTALEIAEDKNAPIMFAPSQYRAPVIMGHTTNDFRFTNSYTQDFVNTVWSITAPFNEALVHGAQVFIKTVPLDIPQAAPTPGSTVAAAPPKAGVPLSLSVFRNQQGVFLPAMTDVEDVQYWRILKYVKDPEAAKPVAGDTIKEGDTIRLCWSFNDQKVGFRDFQADVFGRRRNQIPTECEGTVLYLKMPWPRFESIAPPASVTLSQALDKSRRPMLRVEDLTPNSMIMSTDPRVEKAGIHLPNLPRLKEAGAPGTTCYFGQDVQFRIDTVANDGKGDVNDYLMVDQGNQNAPVYTSKELERLQRCQQQKLMYETFFLGT